MRHMGRPTKLTARVQRALCGALLRGNTRENAALTAGISRSTLTTWLHLGRTEASGRYTSFLAAVEKAEAAAVQASVGVVRHAARDTWQAAAWWLERRYPDEWGRKDRVEITEVLRREAGRLAEEMGLDPEEIVADAERYLTSRR